MKITVVFTRLKHHLYFFIGFRGSNEEFSEYFTFKAPVGKKKVKVKGRGNKTKDATQHSPESGTANRWVTRLRNVIERVNKVSIKCWGQLGGAPLSYQYVRHVDDLVKIAAALSNCFRGCLDKPKAVHDEMVGFRKL